MYMWRNGGTHSHDFYCGGSGYILNIQTLLTSYLAQRTGAKTSPGCGAVAPCAAYGGKSDRNPPALGDGWLHPSQRWVRVHIRAETSTIGSCPSFAITARRSVGIPWDLSPHAPIEPQGPCLVWEPLPILNPALRKNPSLSLHV